ncbi:MAG: GIY-YIG nuclease family protein [Cyclobacteriaceae bacterium]|nr:GIY-YIG nuclease family protein [Cyclobacteriaceae bacterium]
MAGDNCGIYCIQCVATGKVYIGQSNDIRGRKYQHMYHLARNTHNNRYLQRAYNKYGVSSFTFSILTCCDESMLNDIETFLIKALHSCDRSNGFNIREGGCNAPLLQETKERIRQSLMNHEVSEEARAKISKAGKGRVQSPETREKIRKAMKKRVFTEEHRRRISEAKKGKPKSEEHKQKLSDYYRRLREEKARLKQQLEEKNK